MAETKENNRLARFHLELIVGLTLFFGTVLVCVKLIDINQAVNAISELHSQTILIILIFGVISWISRGLRTWILFEELPLRQAIGISFLHNTANNLAPMRLGELALPALTKWLGKVKFSRSLTHLIWIRFLDFISLLCISLCIIVLPISGLWILVILALFIFLTPYLLKMLLPKISQNFLPKILHKAHAQLMLEATQLEKLKRIWRLTVVAWLSKLIGMGMLLTSLSDRSLSTVMATILGAELSSILPIQGFAGVGSYEAGGVLGATFVDQPFIESLALTIQLHIYVLSLTIVFGILGIFLLLKRT